MNQHRPILERLSLIMEEQGHYGALLVPYQVIEDAIDEIRQLQIRMEGTYELMAGEGL